MTEEVLTIMESQRHGQLEISVDGASASAVEIHGGEELSAALASLDCRSWHRAELTLSLSDGPSVVILMNGTHGWLAWFPGDDHTPTMHTENPALETDSRMLEFMLSNGQVDEYPASWTYEWDFIVRALLHAMDYGQPDPALGWVADY